MQSRGLRPDEGAAAAACRAGIENTMAATMARAAVAAAVRAAQVVVRAAQVVVTAMREVPRP